MIKGCLLAGVAVLGLMAAPASADELRDALAAAYTGNPTLLAAREQLRATDAGVPLARADGLPSLNGVASETEYVRQSSLAINNLPRMLSVTASMSVPLYSGGAVRNAIRAADTRVEAGRNDLRATEAGFLLHLANVGSHGVDHHPIAPQHGSGRYGGIGCARGIGGGGDSIHGVGDEWCATPR